MQRDDHCPRDRLAAALAEKTSTHPDVLRELLATFIHTLMGAEADASMLRELWKAQRSTDQLSKRPSPSPIRYPYLHFGLSDPLVAVRFLFPGLATRGAANAPRGRLTSIHCATERTHISRRRTHSEDARTVDRGTAWNVVHGSTVRVPGTARSIASELTGVGATRSIDSPSLR